MSKSKLIVPTDNLTDVEEFHQTPIKVLQRTPEETLLNFLRERLKQGCIIMAEDPKGPVMEKVGNEWVIGLLLRYPRQAEKLPNE